MFVIFPLINKNQKTKIQLFLFVLFSSSEPLNQFYEIKSLFGTKSIIIIQNRREKKKRSYLISI